MEPTKQQQRVIDFHEGVATVSACPGSGKTATLVKRTEALPPKDRKLVLAFNTEAVGVFKSRLQDVDNTDVRTFHSFCTRDIMANYQTYGFTSPPSFLKGGIFRSICEANGLRNVKSWKEAGWDDELVRIAEHCYYDEDLKTRMERARKFLDDKGEGTYSAIMTYRDWMIGNNVISFDSCVRLVAEHRKDLVCEVDHLMVDEYQDVDRFQFDIIIHAARSKSMKSFVVVGDPNQRIYEWRGALSSAFAEITGVFGETTSFDMTTNFRSKDEIIEYADGICPVGMSGVRGSDPKAVTYEPVGKDKVSLAKALTGQDSFNLWDDLTECAVLCRYNRECFQWQIEMTKSKIPSYIIGKGDFWNMKHVKYATKAMEWHWTFDRLIASPNWNNMLESAAYKDNPGRAVEAKTDAEWVMGLTKQDLIIAKTSAQAENGIRISTIHKTKGKEFERVLVNGVTDKLRNDTFVYYVACTRAKDLLVIALGEEKECTS